MSAPGAGTTERSEHHCPPAPAYSIACMEVWGGSEAFDSAVSVPGNDVHVSCTPHEGGVSGGDLYYVSNCAAGLITRFILADVSGHGEEVASIAGELRRIMRRHINTADQTRFAFELNRAFAGLELGGRFATAILATYLSSTDHLLVCNAGHPRPLRYRRRAGGWTLLDGHAPGVVASNGQDGNDTGVRNLPLGILHPTAYEQYALRLEPDDRVVMYTDALIEARDAAGVQLGESGLLEMARSLSEDEMADAGAALRSRVLAYAGRPALDDDATLVVLRHTAADPARPTLAGHIARVAGMLGLGGVDTGPGLGEGGGRREGWGREGGR
ncbi:MAG TPA: PP2C family protein-serine/threonine phosphatase [Phycisphaerales bacterium]|nr:PP2C family protein-serine/threonine phosphatase [Phycisphaerales bacterium]